MAFLFVRGLKMERLIVELSVGDGYTYSATDTLPAVYSSKEEFIIALEDAFYEAVKNYHKVREEQIKSHKEYTDLLNSIIAENKKKKGADSKSDLVEQLKLVELHNKYSDASKSYAHAGEFKFAGQVFSLDALSTNTSYETFFAPAVYTLEEYFCEVEQNV